MVLEELHELIETLQERIAEHGPALQQSEALTRYALIDPLLRGLGWDTGDPSQVLVEFKSGNGKADYALLDADRTPTVIVEAKKLGEPLAGAVSQAINYCTIEGFEYFAVTDGQNWRLYRTHHKGPLTEKLVTRLDLSDSIPKTCIDALALWRPGVIVGSVKTAATPVVGSPPSRAEPTETSTPTAVEFTGVELMADPDPWHKLSEYTPKKGTGPVQIRLPSAEVVAVQSWGWVTKSIVRWLADNKHLSAKHLPIHTSNGKILVSDQSEESDHQTLSEVGPFLVNANFTARSQIKNSRTIIERAGLDSVDFAVKLK